MSACKWNGRGNPRTITGQITDHITIRDAGYQTPCWESDLVRNRDGYTTIHTRPDPPRLLHRVTYELTHGPIPDGLVIDHRENLLRGLGFAAMHAAKTHCKNGHEFTPENTAQRARPEGGRECRACGAIRARERRQRKATL